MYKAHLLFEALRSKDEKREDTVDYRSRKFLVACVTSHMVPSPITSSIILNYSVRVVKVLHGLKKKEGRKWVDFRE